MSAAVAYQINSVLAENASYGYIINAHRSQGSTYNNVYVDLGNILSQPYASAIDIIKSIYVAASRPRTKLVLFDSRQNINGGILGEEKIDLTEINNNIVLGANSNESNVIISKDDNCR